MLLILRSFSARKAKQNAPGSAHRSSALRLRVTSGKCPVTSQTDSSVRRARHDPQQSAQRGGAPPRKRFEIENLIERLEKSAIGVEISKTRRYERSQEVVENKGKRFFHSLQSQEVFENKRVIFVKPRGY